MVDNKKLSEHDLSPGKFDLVRLEQDRRIRHLKAGCTNLKSYKMRLIKYKQVFYFSPKYNFSYCKVTKIGSSFWTQVFSVLLKGPGFAEEIFGMDRDLIHYKLRSQNIVPYTSDERRRSRSILVSRDPYTRLFSAFIDKLFLPQFYVPAKNVVKRQRHFPDNVTVCPNDVTFQEFLDGIVYCINKGVQLNGHWKPITSICNVCSVDVLTIVKQETFIQDVEYTLKEIGITDSEFRIIHDALHDKRVDATIPGVIKTVMTFNLQLNSGRRFCVSDIEIVKRLWKSFQIQGYLRDDIPFPFDIINTEQKAINVSLIEEVVMARIRENPMTSEERKLQRRRALEMAYQDIEVKTIKGIQEVYKPDFLFFDYSIEPPSVKGKT